MHHHRAHPSIALAAGLAGVVPMTPGGAHHLPPHMIAIPPTPGAGQQFQPRSRRAPSISTGGPPKAPLGGPQRKMTSPMPPAQTDASGSAEGATAGGDGAASLTTANANTNNAAAAAAASDNTGQVSTKSKLTKKVIVKLPQELSRLSQDGAAQPLWTRTPLPLADVPKYEPLQPPELLSVRSHPLDWPRGFMPGSLDVFLPGKPAWEDMKRAIIEEKLTKLGVGKGLNPAIAPVLARTASGSLPHGRAASISSPADPGLLLYKLNKLQQAQQASGSPSIGNSLASSPGPPMADSRGSVSPQPPIGTARPIRHGQSMSHFAHNIPGYESGPFNPFGPGAVFPAPEFVPTQREREFVSPLPMHAPQGIVPSQASALLLPTSGRTSASSQRPDFTRGFGLDIPEEDETEAEDDAPQFNSDVFGQPRFSMAAVGLGASDVQTDADNEDDGQDERDDATVPAASRIHSRHQSKLSAALSLRSVGGVRSEGDAAELEERDRHEDLGERSVRSERISHVDPAMADAIAEWTGSEDLRDDESDGEWSNPSDEERARQRRVHRKMMHIAEEDQTPRRLPNFPRPPLSESTFYQQQMQHPPTQIEDDMISNPSDEERIAASGGHLSRPLPPIPATHLRLGSDGYPQLAPGFAHSRGGSGTAPTSLAAVLNPNAKPFVFGSAGAGAGAAHTSISGLSAFGATEASNSPKLSHERQLSVNGRLNATAKEFTPTFTFRPPPAAPALSFPEPTPLWSKDASGQIYNGRAEQGREKRVRRSDTMDTMTDTQSETSEVYSRDGRDEITTWSFPLAKQGVTAPVSASDLVVPPTPGLNPAAKVFTFTGFAGAGAVSAPIMQPVPVSRKPEPEHSRTPSPELDASIIYGPSPVQSLTSEPVNLALDMDIEEVRIALSGTPGSATMTPTLPDYKHPVSTNTVPASLFKKALERLPSSPSGLDGPTRGNVRSRLSSRDVLAPLGAPRNSSLDDLHDENVPSISRKVSKTMLMANHGMPVSQQQQMPEPFNAHPSMPVAEPYHAHQQVSSRGVLSPPPSKGKIHPRRSSMHSLDTFSDASFESDGKHRIDLESYEQRLEDMLEDKLEALRRDLIEAKAMQNVAANGLSADAIAELVGAMRAQSQSQTVAQAGGFDPGLMRNIIEESHLDIQQSLQADMRNMMASMNALSVGRARSPMPMPQFDNGDVTRAVEEANNQTLLTIEGLRSQLAARIEDALSVQRVQSAQVAEMVVQRIAAVNARLDELRQPQINVDVLTNQLVHAVKPNIAQLIDLASDKKETAILITKQLAPMVEKMLLASQALDTDSVAAQLAAEISRIVPPVDQHTLKEQVSDLVVERLDSRLAVRERANNNTDAIVAKVLEGVSQSLQPVAGVREAIQRLTESQTSLISQTDALLVSHGDYLSHVSNIPTSVHSVSEALAGLRQEVIALKDKRPEDKVSPAVANLAAQVQHISLQLDSRGGAQDKLQTVYEDVQRRVTMLPGLLRSSVEELRESFAEVAASAPTSRPEQEEELRALLIAKTDAETQLQRLQAANGQLGYEKESLADRLATMEAENRLLRSQLEEQRTSTHERDIKMAKADARVNELQDNLTNALSRLQSSESDAQATYSRLSDLDGQVRELTSERHQLRSKVDSLQLEVSWAGRDKDSALRNLSAAEKERDDMAAQQANWDDLRRTAQHVETLTKLLTSGENDELRELRRLRDRGKVLEGEHSSLQKRFKEQEGKLAELERAAVHARQAAASANQKATESERRAKDLEIELEGARDKLERAEDDRAQFEADYSLLKSHVQEKELEEAVLEEREQKLRDELAKVKLEMVGLKMAADRGKQTPPAGHMHAPRPTSGYAAAPLPNGRPSSRDTIYPDASRSGANTPKLNGISSVSKKHDGQYSPPTNGAWSSMHAPKSHISNHMAYFNSAARAASPTPSVISTVTRRDDGWWDAD
ncbi:hypothetical protein BKA62DRAFT_501365 [Auriculariales sp. MPI-PUGE-AT-0066]|nr:hypothetical protein BKA62DRAFT_501365 [Auriculariales sp. MPI-PUGE-AT-0066]